MVGFPALRTKVFVASCVVAGGDVLPQGCCIVIGWHQGEALRTASLSRFPVDLLEVVGEAKFGQNGLAQRASGIRLQIEDLMVPPHADIHLFLGLELEQANFASQQEPDIGLGYF